MNKQRRMELLAPAGDMDALCAAVQNGADAVYLGAGAFNARQSAANFDGDALKRAVAYCHIRGVKVHVTLNTIVRQDELEALAQTIALVNESGADAVIVQDFGVAAAVRQMAPDIQLHASTQMAVHNVHGAAFLMDHGYDRVVLAREMPFEDIAACAKLGIETETFIHGALCVACSGQCLMSSLVGGRSGNRGRCAQPCRLPWRLDDRHGYLLSTRDLCTLKDLPRLRRTNVTSLKIEGRLKRPEYVAVTVGIYRKALDAMYEGIPYDPSEDIEALMQMFNRGGFTRGYGSGLSDGELMYPQQPNHLGVTVGTCVKNGRVRLSKPVDDADTLVLRRNGQDSPVHLDGGVRDETELYGALPGDRLVRLVSQEQMKSARESFRGERRRVPVEAEAELYVGKAAKLTVSDGLHVCTSSGSVVECARNGCLDSEKVKLQIGKTGGTPFEMADIVIKGDDQAYCPASMLNALRRDALDDLAKQRSRVDRRTGNMLLPELHTQVDKKPLLTVQSADVNRLKQVLLYGADRLVFAPEDVRFKALDSCDLSGIAGDGRLYLALSAVLTREGLDAVNHWANAHAQWFAGTYLSNIGQMGLTWPGEKIADYMLNAANDLCIRQLADWGVQSYTTSVELNARQIARMGGKKELVVWGRIPLMHLRHCPLRAARGMKGAHQSCRHCDGCSAQDRVNAKEMIDRTGAAFPLRRLAMPGGCVVQVLNSACMMLLRRTGQLPHAHNWRLLIGSDDPVREVVALHRAAIDGMDPRRMPEWEAVEKMNTTTGHYFRGVD